MRLTPAEARRRFLASEVATLATIGLDGAPHVVPVVFAVDGERILTAVDAKPKASQALARLANIEHEPRVALLADRYETDWRQLWWARADGIAQVVRSGPERDAAIRQLRARYPAYARLDGEFGAAIVVQRHALERMGDGGSGVSTHHDTVLETDGLLLRRLTADDRDLLVQLDSDPQVTFHITGGPPEFTDEMLAHWLDEYERWPQLGVWAAVERESGQFVGWFHLRPDEGRTDVLELGYRLRRSAWGRGYATEGSRALVEKAFRELGAERVTAYSLAMHAASRRVMEKAGLRFVRAFHANWPYRIPGDEAGDVAYALTRAEWEGDQR